MYKIWKNLLFIFGLAITLQSEAQTDLRSDSFDVLHYDIQLVIRKFQLKQIGGTTSIAIVSKQNNLTQLRFDLIGLQISSIRQNSIPCLFSHIQGSILVNLSQSLSIGDTTIIDIAYSGQPITDSRWGGFYFNGNYAYNMGVGMGSNPSTFGRCWFPCVDNFTERATYDFRITTDSGFAVACGGILQSQTSMGDSIVWHWKLHQTIPTYLASVAVGKYSFVKYTYQGLQSSYPVWLAAIPGDTARLKQSFAKLNAALQCFESKFGPYLFDRVGYAAVPFNAGAMEHAANIAYPIYAIDGTSANETLMAHELAHNWFGNLVTCSSAQDMWLNEGWASYCEALFLECAYGKDAYYENIRNKCNEVNLNAARSDGAWSPVSGVSFENTYGRHVYTKGALVVHNLRETMGDSAFFAACRSYLNSNLFLDVNSETLKNEFQKFTSHSLHSFFETMVYDSGQVAVLPKIINYSQPNDVGDESYSIKLFEVGKFKTNNLAIKHAILNIHYRDSIRNILLPLINGASDVVGNISGNIFMNPILAITVNYQSGMALASNYERKVIKTTGSGIAFNNTLFSINPRAIIDSAVVTVSHHWVPTLNLTELNENGIRINTDRFWRVDLFATPSTEIWGFFNYDGSATAFLDNTFLKNLITEDSIVLLYRPLGGKWQVHTAHTFQPGPSKTDKTGRFWVDRISAGEYTFGIRDASVVGLSELGKQTKNAFNFYVYPNPSNGIFNIHASVKLKNAHLIVYDKNGKVVCETQVNGIEAEVSCKQLKKGVYFITISMDNQVASSKLIIE
jgi:aminopeptidase N